MPVVVPEGWRRLAPPRRRFLAAANDNAPPAGQRLRQLAPLLVVAAFLAAVIAIRVVGA